MPQITPITPAEAKQQRQANIPDFVFDVVNKLLVDRLNGVGNAVIYQDDIAKAIRGHEEYLAYDEPRPDIYAHGWMDFEPHYRRSGWNVEYERSAYYDTSPSLFRFSSIS